MSAWSRSAVLDLYRAILRKGRRLEFTNKEYYFRRMRQEFNDSKDISDEATRSKKLQVMMIDFNVAPGYGCDAN